MKRVIILIAATLPGCSSQSFDPMKEAEAVKRDLFTEMFEAFKTKNADKALESVPEQGDIFVSSGDVMRDSRDQIRKYHEEQFAQARSWRYEFVKEPSIEFIGTDHCYGTAVWRVVYTLESDTTHTEKEMTKSTLFVGRKRDNGKWERVASSETVLQDRE
jgi:uncharacterized protein (TIGR02246 family)